MDLDLEPFPERNERLGRDNPRQSEIDSLLAAMEAEDVGNLEGTFEALTMLLCDAILDQDDYSLRLLMDGSHRLLAIWGAALSAPGAVAAAAGKLEGLHNVASMTLERIVPLAILAELEPDTLIHHMLEAIADEGGSSNDDLVATLGSDRTAVSRAGRRLHSAGLARKRRAGRRNSWEITPRGLAALGSVNAGGRSRPRRRQGLRA